MSVRATRWLWWWVKAQTACPPWLGRRDPSLRSHKASMKLTLAPTRSTGRLRVICLLFYFSLWVPTRYASWFEWLNNSWLSLAGFGGSIPMDSYSSSIEQQTSLDRPELPGSMEQSSMSRSQSAPMLDDELGFPGHGASNQNQLPQNQKPSIPQKAYHFDHNYNPQVNNFLATRRHEQLTWNNFLVKKNTHYGASLFYLESC